MDDEFCRGWFTVFSGWKRRNCGVRDLWEAEEALHFLEENVVDIVLTDIEMAEMDGLSFIREIRERRLGTRGDYCELP